MREVAAPSRRLAAFLLLPLDTRERHLVAARLVGRPRQLLDVGGKPRQLSLFLPGVAVTTVNVEPPADLLFDGRALPFPDGSFDAVTTLDVLEHLDAEQRLSHLAEVLRVTRGRVVLCCPLGSGRHVQAERELADWYRRRTGGAHRFLEEHLRLGLPTETELAELIGRVGGAITAAHLYFHGDLHRIDRAFRAQVEAVAGRRPSALLGYAARRLLTRADTALQDSAGDATNRAFLVLDRAV